MRARFWVPLLSVSVLAGCASTRKPNELIALENLRQAPALSDPDRRAFDLLAAADNLMVQSSRAWEHHDAYATRRDALMGQIEMKTALALMEQERLTAKLSQLDAELGISQEEEERLESELGTAEEEVTLLERLNAAKRATAAERKALSEQADSAKRQAATEKRKAEAANAIRVLELTLKVAETVDASRYAKAPYTAATGMLQDAHQAFDAGRWDDALTRTTLAQAEADKATALARPQYEKASQALSNQARDRALEADATAIEGVETRLVRQGDLQRLVLVIPGVFPDRRSAIRPERAKIIDAIKDLLGRYPTYPLQLTGYADEPGKADDLAALSLARANAVYWALVARGIDPKRMSVEGKATSSSAGDARVELSILYSGPHRDPPLSAAH
jgi:outer membrane protein OmpA-like peptidoglycan-associated protein